MDGLQIMPRQPGDSLFISHILILGDMVHKTLLMSMHAIHQILDLLNSLQPTGLLLLPTTLTLCQERQDGLEGYGGRPSLLPTHHPPLILT